MEDQARIVLGVETEELADEVMDFLDRTGQARVVATARDASELATVLARETADVIVGSPNLVRAAGAMNGCPFLALATGESVAVLREAMEAGARSFFVWPGEREGLRRAAVALVSGRRVAPAKRAAITAVFGARGGSGATFVATHLASALARRSRDTVLVDLDGWFGDVSGALGVPFDHPPRTVGDLGAVARELSAQHVEDVLWRHDDGFRALLAPPSPNSNGKLEPIYRSAVRALSPSVDDIVLHLPRTLDHHAEVVFEQADRVLIVITLDVMAFRAGKRTLDVLAHAGKTFHVVVNRATRSEIVPADVERAFGKPAIAVIPAERRVRAAQDRGQLLSRGPAVRAIDRLAEALMEETP